MGLTKGIFEHFRNYLSLYDTLKEISKQFNENIDDVVLFVLHENLLLWNSAYYQDKYFHMINFNNFANGDYQIQENERNRIKNILEEIDYEFSFTSYILDDDLYSNTSLTDGQKNALSKLKQVNYYFYKPELTSYSFNGSYLKFKGINDNSPSIADNKIQQVFITQTNDNQAQRIADQTAQLQAEIDRLTAKNQQQADTIQQLNERLEAGTPAEPIGDNSAYDWQAMDKNIYPPELHLAMMIWEQYYDPNLADMSQFSTPKFDRIATNIGLEKGNLKDRIRTLLTPTLPKLKSNDLFKSLKSIKGLYLQDFNPPE